MKSLAGIGAAGLVAIAVALWFTTGLTLVSTKSAPLTISSDAPLFKGR
jgi:hypothetical protein